MEQPCILVLLGRRLLSTVGSRLDRGPQTHQVPSSHTVIVQGIRQATVQQDRHTSLYYYLHRSKLDGLVCGYGSMSRFPLRLSRETR
jgi:hypothetical protein